MPVGQQVECPYCHREFIPQTREPVPQIEPYQDEYIMIDPNQFLVVINGKRVRLTATEHRLLACLLANRGRIMSPRQILTIAWGWEYIDDLDYVRVYVWHLRHKIEPDPTQPKYIITEPGIGYYFNKEVTDG